MIIKKNLSFRSVYEFVGHHVWWLTGWMSLVAIIYHVTHWKFMTIPWLPISLVGTAVAFYIGFKNNHSYDRLWGAIQIWSSIMNNSRRLAAMVNHYRSDERAKDDGTEIRRQIVYRHIAYLYQLREQLLEPMSWEHVKLQGIWKIGADNQKRRDRINSWYREELEEVANRRYLSDEEEKDLEGHHNKAVQILNRQTKMIQLLYENKAINMIQQIEIQGAIHGFYNEQGNVERIKQIPFPRKYASFSFMFVCLFVFLLPFGIIGEFSKLGDWGIWLSIPVGVIVAWVYVVMEMIGDYSENPFEGLHNDVPMLSMCRSIEIDMLEMIGEKDIPRPIPPKKFILL